MNNLTSYFLPGTFMQKFDSIEAGLLSMAAIFPELEDYGLPPTHRVHFNTFVRDLNQYSQVPSNNFRLVRQYSHPDYRANQVIWCQTAQGNYFGWSQLEDGSAIVWFHLNKKGRSNIIYEAEDTGWCDQYYSLVFSLVSEEEELEGRMETNHMVPEGRIIANVAEINYLKHAFVFGIYTHDTLYPQYLRESIDALASLEITVKRQTLDIPPAHVLPRAYLYVESWYPEPTIVIAGSHPLKQQKHTSRMHDVIPRIRYG